MVQWFRGTGSTGRHYIRQSVNPLVVYSNFQRFVFPMPGDLFVVSYRESGLV